jgi:serine/threonine protein kinase
MAYNFKEKLGEGSFGQVYLATLKEQNPLAIFLKSVNEVDNNGEESKLAGLN